MPPPLRSFLNLLLFASAIGLLMWREHSWQLKWRTAEARTEALGALPVAKGGGGSGSDAASAELLSANALLQKNLIALEGRASALAAEVQSLKEKLEAAKPAPVPGDLAKLFKEQRGLAFDPEPVWTPVPMDTILEKIRGKVEAALPPEAAEARSRAALAMGFHSEPFDYRDALVSLAQMTSGGFFDESEGKFFYRAEASLVRADGRETFIGALAAALTQRKAGPGVGNLYDSLNDDMALAARSLMSGDANASRVRFSIADQLNLNFDRSGAPAAPPPNYSAPPYLAEIWKFSQDKGSLFVETLSGQGGNATVDEAYRRIPKSTAEILHPELLYLAKPPFEPVPVDFSGTTLGGQPPFFSNVAGELGTYVALRSWLNGDEASMASEGWAGDRYVIWPGKEGVGDQLYWKTVWRTQKDAKEFFDMMRRVVMQRFSIPWQKVQDAVANQYRVDDPHRIVRLELKEDQKTVTLINCTAPDFAVLVQEAASNW
jgi:hypothetical protein